MAAGRREEPALASGHRAGRCALARLRGLERSRRAAREEAGRVGRLRRSSPGVCRQTGARLAFSLLDDQQRFSEAAAAWVRRGGATFRQARCAASGAASRRSSLRKQRETSARCRVAATLAATLRTAEEATGRGARTPRISRRRARSREVAHQARPIGRIRPLTIGSSTRPPLSTVPSWPSCTSSSRPSSARFAPLWRGLPSDSSRVLMARQTRQWRVRSRGRRDRRFPPGGARRESRRRAPVQSRKASHRFPARS